MKHSEPTIRKNYLHPLWRVPAILFWLLFMPCLFFILRALKIKFHENLPHYFHYGVQKILGLKVSYSGELSDYRPTLYVSNHISYLDIFVLGNIRGYFIAKSEVAGWPVLGQLARFQNTLFIERSAGKSRMQLELLQSYLADGKSLILFPEGTSTNGKEVKPFRSSLFEAAYFADDQIKVNIQPVTVAYTQQAGVKMNQPMLDHYAWYNTMPFLPHFLKLFVLSSVEVKVHFHPCFYPEQFDSRKACAEHSFKLVEEKLHEFVD